MYFQRLFSSFMNKSFIRKCFNFLASSNQIESFTIFFNAWMKRILCMILTCEQCCQLDLMKFRQRTDFFVAKIANPQKRQIFNFCTFKNHPKSPIFPNKSSNFAKITHFFFGDFSKSNFVGDFCKKVVANLRPKIADLAKNRQSWQLWKIVRLHHFCRCKIFLQDFALKNCPLL